MKLLILVLALCALAEVKCDITSRIVGGHTALPNTAPWTVSIQNPTHICGGALIKNNWILTAASCIPTDTTSLNVLAGSNRLLTNMKKLRTVSVKKHPSYAPATGLNDLGLIQIEPVTVSSRIQTIPLADAAVTSGLVTTFSGWGYISSQTTAKSNYLQILYQKSLTFADCKLKNPSDSTLVDGLMCAHIQTGQGACGKDIGGPLVAAGKLIGVLSRSDVQCSGNTPDVFVDVFPLITWITTEIGG